MARTRVDRGALFFFAGREGVFACCVENVTNHGGVRPNFRTIRRCRLAWRSSDFIGVQFLS